MDFVIGMFEYIFARILMFFSKNIEIQKKKHVIDEYVQIFNINGLWFFFLI